MRKQLSFTHERSTKNTERFAEDGNKNDHSVGVLYVQRSAFNGSVPTKLTVTIESNG